MSSAFLPLKKALFFIFLSVVAVSGSCAAALLYYHHWKSERRSDSKNQIVALVQTSSDAEGLKTAYLAELLDLSFDRPANLYSFNTKDALHKLQCSPVIKEATITKIYPGTIWVDYVLRKPIAILGDYSNAMIDREGTVLPIKPFFTPKRLPEIILGRLDEEMVEETQEKWGQEKGFHWGAVLQGKRLKIAFALLDWMSEQCCLGSTRLERIDVSKAFSLSYGQRQVVIVVEHSCEREVNGKLVVFLCPRMLRLDADHYQEQMKNYVALSAYLDKHYVPPPSAKGESTVQEKMQVIDLRIPGLGFISSFFNYQIIGGSDV